MGQNSQITAELRIKAIVQEATQELNKFSTSAKEMWQNQSPPKSVLKTFEQLENRLESLRQIANKGKINASELSQAKQDYKAFQKVLRGMGVDFKLFTQEQKRAMLGEAEAKNIEKRADALAKYNKIVKKNVELTNKRKPLEADRDTATRKIRLAEASNKMQLGRKAEIESGKPKQSKAVEEYIKKLERQKELTKDLAALEESINAKRNQGYSVKEGADNVFTRQLEREKQLRQELEAIDLSDGKAEYEAYAAAIDKADKEIAEIDDRIDKNNRVINTAKEQINSLNKKLNQLELTDEKQAFDELKKALKAAGVEGVETATSLDQLKKKVKDLDTQAMAQVETRIKTTITNLGQLQGSMSQAEGEFDRTTNRIKEQNAALGEQQVFVSRIKQFFGLAGAVQLTRKAFQNAFSTIKDLDAAMTEMAVVTELDVGDYWNQLPEYTKRANELGVSIKAAYESATLYYQQGLKTNEVVAMSNETLKMARIAGLSAEDATNKMTAALRGFNMELNETSAQRVADVYSELAAITASDVKEISSAMTKTASIASSAGMEFETTAAFLSQIIETTRESAETAGTALKTVIARFQELKKDPAEIGEVDGEVVDANKIETALRSVGVALRDTSGQFRDLDDVFLELSSKWDSLDTNTQRYIATIAAGSRQQSRFIAMMSDYSRTQDLVTAANNSAGASNEQFEKTLDSLRSKLNELKNSWDTFTMSLMDNEFIKVGVEILNSLLSTINSIVAGLDRFGLGGAASIGMITSALMLGTKTIKTFEQHLLEVDKKGNRVRGTFGAIGETGKTAFDSIKKSIQKVHTTLVNYKRNLDQISKVNKNQLFSKEASAAREKYTQVLQREQTINQKLAKTKEQLNNQQVKDAALLQKQAALENLSASATQSRAWAVGSLYTAMELTEEQQKQANILTAQGVSEDVAAMLAKYGVALADLAEEESLENLNEERAKEIILDKLKSKTVKGKLLGILATITGMKIENGEVTKNIAKEKVNIATKVTSTIAQWAYTAAIWAGIPPMAAYALAVLAIVAAIAVLVVAIIGIIALFKKLKANSPEGKLKAAEEAAEAAGEAAEAAAEAYDNLAESFDNLADKYNTLEELTQGTREWRDAVKEINSEILELINNYPELAKFVKNEGGVLTIDIDSAEVQDVLTDYSNRAILAQTAEVASKISVAQAKNVVEYKALSNKATVGSEGAILTEKILGTAALAGAVTTGIATAGIGTAELGAAGALALAHAHEKENKANTEKLSKALADGLLMQDEYGNWITKESEETAQAFKDIGLSADAAEQFANALGDNAEELRDYGLAVKQRAEQEEALYDAMAMSAVQMVNTAGLLEEEIQQINNAATSEYIKFFEKEAEKKIAELLDDKSNKEGKDYLEERAKEIYGTEDIKVTNNKVIIGTGDDAKEISREEFEKQLASTQGIDKATKALENLPDAIENLSKKMGSETSKALERSYMKKEAGAMTKADLEALQMNEDKLYAAFENLSDEDKESFGDVDTFKKHIEDTIEIGNKAFETATKSLEKMGATIEFNEKQFTADAVKGYAEQLEYIMASSGQQGVNAVNEALKKLTEDMDTDDFNKFMGQLNAMDWKNMEDWENLPELLKELDITLPNVEIEAFTNEMSKLAGAVKKVDLETLNEQILTLQGLSKNLKSGERTISSSDYEALIKADPELASQFQQNLDGDYVFLDSMEKLTEAIDKNTDALLGQAVDQLQNKVDAGQLLKEMSTWKFSDGSSGDINKWKEWEDDGLATNVDGFLRLFIEQANSQGIDLSKTNIKGLSNDLNIEALMKDESLLEEVMDGLVGLFGELGTNTELLSAKITNSLGLIYQNRDATENSYEASIYRNKLAATGVLNENEQNIMDASTGAITVQAEASGISVVDIDKYKKAISGLKKLQDDLADQKITLDQFKESYAALAREAEKFEKQVSNKTNFRNMNIQLEETISSMGELTEKFDTLKDKSEKIETVGKMVEDLGISVNTANYEQISNLVKQITEGGENAYEAFQQLMQMSSESFGLTLEDLVLMTSEKWNDSTNQMSESMQAFANRMVAIGSAMWKKLGDGSKEFAWATKNNLADAAEAAGTVVEMWENPYDELYNLNQKLNAQIHERERAERAYERAVKDSSTSVQDLAQITGQQLELLKQEAIVQKDIAQQSLQNIANKRAENSQYDGLYSIDYDTGKIQVDWKQAEQMGWNTDEGSEFGEFISYLEEQTEAALDAQDAIDDISDAVDEIEQRGKDATSEIYNQVKEGLVKQYENQITELENINNSIQEASADMISKMQEQINDARKARDKEKTQSQIADKQTRLAYLKADSSGMNALEIASLEKEISDAQESYTDSLIDEAIEKLQEDNEKAAEQRQEQIELQRSQLEAYVESGKVWEDVQRITNEGFAQVAKGVPFAETEAGHLANLAADLKAMNPIEAEEFKTKLEETAKEGTIFTNITGGVPGKSLTDVVNELQHTLANLKDEADDPPPRGNIDNSPNTGEDTDEDDGNLGDDQQPSKEEPSEPEPKPETTPQPTKAPSKLWSTYQDVVDDGYDGIVKSEKEFLSSSDYGLYGSYEKYLTAMHSKYTRQFSNPSTNTSQSKNEPVIGDSIVYESESPWTDFDIANAIGGKLVKIVNEEEFQKGIGIDRGKTYEGGYKEYLDDKYNEFQSASLQAAEAKDTGLFGYKLNTKDLFNKNNDVGLWTIGNDTIQFEAEGGSDEGIADLARIRNVPSTAILKYGESYYAYKDGGAFRIAKVKKGGTITDTSKIALSDYLAFKSGGLADFTGPAWLDGTKSKPEIVLNQTDSANFMQLRDILADILNGTSNTSQEGGKGDNYFDIEINVDSLNDDYDVEQLADKIRGMIYDDATYRNVNTINSVR